MSKINKEKQIVKKKRKVLMSLRKMKTCDMAGKQRDSKL
jgi:hypothetical protein